MPWTLTNPYCALQDLKDALRLTDTNEDNRLIFAINSASRQIENYTQRRFWQDLAASPRLYVPTTEFLVEVDDFQTTAGLVVKTDYGDGTFPLTWASSDYQLEPLNAQFDGQPWAFDKIRSILSKLFPVYGRGWPLPNTYASVQVTAQWGWAAIPDDVAKACVIQSQYLFKVDDAPLGATAFAETGILRLKDDIHPAARALLGPYMSQGVLVA